MAYDFNPDAPLPPEGGFDNAWKEEYKLFNEAVPKARLTEVVILHVEGVVKANHEGIYRERLQVTVGTPGGKRFKITLYGPKCSPDGKTPENGTHTHNWAEFMGLACRAGLASGEIFGNVRVNVPPYETDGTAHRTYNAFDGKKIQMALVFADRGIFGTGNYAYTGRFVQAKTHLSFEEVQKGATQPQEIAKITELVQKDHDNAGQGGVAVNVRPSYNGMGTRPASPAYGTQPAAPAYGAQTAVAPAPAPAPAPAGKPRGQTVAINPLTDDIPF